MAQYSTLEVSIHGAPEVPKHTYAPEAIQNTQSHTQPRAPERRICGLRPPTFWLSLALLVMFLLVVAAAAVGGTYASNHSPRKATNSTPIMDLGTSTTLLSTTIPTSSHTPNPTTTTTTTITTSPQTPNPTTATTLPTPSFNPSNECPSSNNTKFTASLTGSTFQIICGIDYGNGTENADGTDIVRDIIGIFSSSMEQCIDGCASYNAHQGSHACMAVSYTADLSESWVPRNQANCYLKSAIGRGGNFADAVTVAGLIAS